MKNENVLKDRIEAAITQLLYLRVKYPEDFIVNDESFEKAILCLDDAASIMEIEYLFKDETLRENFIIQDSYDEYNNLKEKYKGKIDYGNSSCN